MNQTLKRIRIAAVIVILLAFSQCKKPNNCTLNPETGNCKAAIPRYYFDQNTNKCKEFIWGGCGGVVPFISIKDCQEQCE